MATPSRSAEEVEIPSSDYISENEAGEDFWTYVLMLAIFLALGVAMWWAGVHKHLRNFRGRTGKTKGIYAKVGDDEENLKTLED